MIKKKIQICLYCIAFIGNAYSQHWQALNFELNAPTRSFYSDTITNEFYIGGEFTNVNGIYSNHILKWDGLNYYPIGNTLVPYSFSQVRSITRFDGCIYIAPDKDFLYKWSGSQWDTIGPNDGGIISLYTYNNELYAGGCFTEINGISANSIAKWDGTQWHSLGFPVADNGCVLTIIIFKDELYIGGVINDSTGYHNCIARWDGSNWQWLGNGIKGSMAGVNDMVVYKEELYIAGTFSKIECSTNPGNYIAKWDGNNWSDVGGGVSMLGANWAWINALEVYHDELYAVGVFEKAGGVPAQYIAKWDGTKWCGLGSDFDNSIDCLGVYQDMLYLGGGFWTIDGDSMHYIAKWTGGNYNDTCSTPSGINEMINNKNSISIFPNPASYILTIEVSQRSIIEISNIQGQLMESFVANANKSNIDIANFSSGVYIIRAQTDKGITTKKFIKE